MSDLSEQVTELTGWVRDHGGAAVGWADRVDDGTPWAWLPDSGHRYLTGQSGVELPSAACTWWDPHNPACPGADELALTDEECDQITDLARDLGLERGLGPKRADEVVVTEVDLGDALTDRLAGIGAAANACWWRFSLESMTGLILRYRPGHRHRRHCDHHPGSTTRKLALMCQLSDPDDYEGGDLVLSHWPEETETPRARGTVVACPGWTHHEVAPVTAGERWALVVWFYGAPLR